MSGGLCCRYFSTLEEFRSGGAEAMVDEAMIFCKLSPHRQTWATPFSKDKQPAIFLGTNNLRSPSLSVTKPRFSR